jgi:dihydroorotase
MNQTVTITRPDDWHIHLRDGDSLLTTVKDVSRYFGRAIVMPNLVPPVTNTEQAQAYRQRILNARPANSRFEPLMVLYLTDNLDPAEIKRAKSAGIVAAKLYPAGATTNSAAGVTNINNIYPVLAAMEEAGMLLLIHGEVTDAHIDIFDREAVFIDRTLQKLVRDFPQLKIVFEHITTQQAVDFVRTSAPTVAATITAHHLLYNRNDMLVGGIRPHYFCLPILKRQQHQEALVAAAISGNPKFFLGTDSAPHAQNKKETACGCAGCYTAHAAIELYAQAFEAAGAMDKLEGFASFFGADFYGLPRNKDTITLKKTTWQPPHSITFGNEQLIPLAADKALHWQVIAKHTGN